MPTQHRRGSAPLTYTFIGINVLISLYIFFVNPTLMDQYALTPSEWINNPITLVTSVFLHANFYHLFGNMIALFICAPLERHVGSFLYLLIYVGSAALGDIAVISFATDPNIPTVGASGAIFGLFGALAILGRQAGISVSSIVFVIVINLGVTFTNPEISWQAHVGGLIGGAALGLLARLITSSKQNQIASQPQQPPPSQ